jgi:hypothetical protein
VTARGATPSSVLDLAAEVARDRQPALKGIWPRAAVLLARQALEMAIDQLWQQIATPGAGKEVSMRARLLCLTDYVPGDAVGNAAVAWVELSRASHFHPYELAPSGLEVAALLELAARTVGALEASVIT